MGEWAEPRGDNNAPELARLADRLRLLSHAVQSVSVAQMEWGASPQCITQGHPSPAGEDRALNAPLPG